MPNFAHRGAHNYLCFRWSRFMLLGTFPQCPIILICIPLYAYYIHYFILYPTDEDILIYYITHHEKWSYTAVPLTPKRRVRWTKSGNNSARRRRWRYFPRSVTLVSASSQHSCRRQCSKRAMQGRLPLCSSSLKQNCISSSA